MVRGIGTISGRPTFALETCKDARKLYVIDIFQRLKMDQRAWQSNWCRLIQMIMRLIDDIYCKAHHLTSPIDWSVLDSAANQGQNPTRPFIKADTNPTTPGVPSRTAICFPRLSNFATSVFFQFVHCQFTDILVYNHVSLPLEVSILEQKIIFDPLFVLSSEARKENDLWSYLKAKSFSTGGAPCSPTRVTRPS